MRKIILNIASSFDGFIAKMDDSVDFLHQPEFELIDDDYGLSEFYETIDTVLMGGKTYRIVRKLPVDWPYADVQTYIFSRTQGPVTEERIQFITTEIPEFVANLKAQGGKDIWLIGGGEINALLLRHDLIDEMVLTLMPVTLNEGIPLWNGDVPDVKWESIREDSWENGVVQMHYRRV